MSERGVTEFSAHSLIESLNRHNVAFVIIGGFAGVLYGSPRVTDDLDICPARDETNLTNLASALREMKAQEWEPHRGGLEGRDWEAGILSSDHTWLLVTEHGALDLLFEPEGTAGFDALESRATRINLGESQVLVASLDDLIQMKEASDRPEDRGELEILSRLKRREANPPNQE